MPKKILNEFITDHKIGSDISDLIKDKTIDNIVKNIKAQNDFSSDFSELRGIDTAVNSYTMSWLKERYGNQEIDCRVDFGCLIDHPDDGELATFTQDTFMQLKMRDYRQGQHLNCDLTLKYSIHHVFKFKENFYCTHFELLPQQSCFKTCVCCITVYTTVYFCLGLHKSLVFKDFIHNVYQFIDKLKF